MYVRTVRTYGTLDCSLVDDKKKWEWRKKSFMKEAHSEKLKTVT